MTISLKQLRYFVAVVEAGGYSQAADRLYIAQSAISRQIKELEEASEVLLLKRNSRNVALTPAGEVFYKGVKDMLDQLQETLVESRYVDRGGQGTMRVLHSSSVPLAGVLMAGINAHLKCFPAINCEIGTASSEHQIADIEERRADIGFARLPVLRRAPNVVITSLYKEKLCVALPEKHPLANEILIDIDQLRTDLFVSVPHRERGGLSRRVADLCLKAGFFPKSARVVSRKLTQLNIVAAGLGVAVVPESLRTLSPPGLRFVPLGGEGANSTVAALYHREATDMIMNFVATVSRLVDCQQSQIPPAKPAA